MVKTLLGSSRERALRDALTLMLLCFAFSGTYTAADAQQKTETVVGIPTVLSGDFAVLGENIETTVSVYQKHYLRHPIKVVFEDARVNSRDGLMAFQKLINTQKVDVIISGCSTNCLVAGKTLINSKRIPTISIVTGGRAADTAGPYVFRLGNSDTINGILEAKRVATEGLNRVAILTEETEATGDVRHGFVNSFPNDKSVIVVDERFAPETTDFRSLISRVAIQKPDALIILTQTGRPLGLILKQWAAQNLPIISISTTFVAAANPDAAAIAGPLINGVKYMAPAYDVDGEEWQRFLSLYQQEYGKSPAIEFHAAGVVDSLNLLQKFLDQEDKFDAEKFQKFLLNTTKYKGLMGEFSFDAEGNTDLGFKPAIINISQ